MAKKELEKQLKSTRSDNRLKQLRFLCQLIEDTETTIPNLLDPENFEKPLVKECSGPAHFQQAAIITFKKHQAEYMAELYNFAAYLHLSPLETFVITAIAARQIGRNDDAVTVNDITDFLDMNGLDGLPLRGICDNLVDKQYLDMSYNNFRNHNNEPHFNIPTSVVESICYNNAEINFETKVPMDKYEFCKKASELIHNSDTFTNLIKAIRILEEKNPKVEFVNKLKALEVNKTDRILFYEIANDCINGVISDIATTCEDVFCEAHNMRIGTMKAIKNESHKLIQLGLVEICPNSFFDHSDISLTDNGQDFFFGEDKIVFERNKKSSKKLTNCEDIPTRELFYDKELTSDIAFLEKSLDVTEFKKLQERMTAKAMNKGVAVLFYGAPGTGKTETVMQLARRTGRKVYHVDISASKTCWYGESEKLIKGIFTSYKRMCKEEPVTPILLFNEADALLGKRHDNIRGSIDQTDNAIQNILLEEMEKLEGIMIATTNFESNLDAAFERRFLMKINFRKPSIESKEAIWHYKLPILSTADCHTLALRYDLSGGEIDNVVRKVTMTEVLQGTTPTIEDLCSLCEKERLSKERCRIGF